MIHSQQCANDLSHCILLRLATVIDAQGLCLEIPLHFQVEGDDPGELRIYTEDLPCFLLALQTRTTTFGGTHNHAQHPIVGRCSLMWSYEFLSARYTLNTFVRTSGPSCLNCIPHNSSCCAQRGFRSRMTPPTLCFQPVGLRRNLTIERHLEK